MEKLEHYGVLGMHWGHRKNKKIIKKEPKPVWGGLTKMELKL